MNEKYELTDEQIGEIYDEPCDWALPHMITFARAIITADRALRASPAPVGDVEKAWRRHLDQANRESWCAVTFDPKHMNKIVGELDKLRTSQQAPAVGDIGMPLTNAVTVPSDKLREMQAALATKDAEIAKLTAENLTLDDLCDATYVAEGADAYHHAVEVLEQWQEKRFKEGKDRGCLGSLCGAMEWLYARVGSYETAIATLTAERDALRKDSGRWMAWRDALSEQSQDEESTAELFKFLLLGDGGAYGPKTPQQIEIETDAAIAAMTKET